MSTIPPSSPDHYLSQGSSVEYTPALNYQQIIIPTNGLDTSFVTRIATLLEYSFENPEHSATLTYLMEESLRQFGDCFHLSHFQFLFTLQGNTAEGGNVPGYPVPGYLSHTPLVSPDNWERFVMMFRDFALNMYALITPYARNFPTAEFVYHKWVYGGLVFYITPKNSSYEI